MMGTKFSKGSDSWEQGGGIGEPGVLAAVALLITDQEVTSHVRL